MFPDWILAMFDDHKRWLERQPGMHPWQASCRRLVQQLSEWLEVYSQDVCEQVVTEERQQYGDYIGRMWICWAHHWEQAAQNRPGRVIDGCEVATQVRAGQGYSRGGRLGGDPLRDVVLAVAMTVKDGKAPEQFHADFFDISTATACRLNHRFQHDPDDWWWEFVDFLAGYSNPPGKLEKFDGRCALRNWLPIVLRNFLSRRPLEDGQWTDDLDEGEQPLELTAEVRECAALFSQVISAAMERLSKGQRLLLCLLYVEELSGKQVACILGVHPGNVTRKREAAIDRLQQEIGAEVRNRGQEQAYRDCLELIKEDPADFGAAMCEALQRSGTQEDEQ